MTSKELLADFQRMLKEKWEYVMGSSSPGAVDCSGAFVWSFGQHGKSIYHGSNRILRTEIRELLPIDQWKPGMAAFKRRMPGQQGYALPESYQPGGKHYNGDLNDYYHIGLVDEDGSVLNAQSTQTGFVRSKLDGSWCGVGYLKQVDYGQIEAGTTAVLALVIAQSGNMVRLRKNPSDKAETLYKVPLGATVQVLAQAEGWATVEYQGMRGYMMAEFLQTAEQSQIEDGEAVSILLPRSDAEKLYDALLDALARG